MSNVGSEEMAYAESLASPQKFSMPKGGDIERFDQVIERLHAVESSLRGKLDVVLDPSIETPYPMEVTAERPPQTALANRIEQVEQIIVRLTRIEDHLRL